MQIQDDFDREVQFYISIKFNRYPLLINCAISAIIELE